MTNPLQSRLATDPVILLDSFDYVRRVILQDQKVPFDDPVAFADTAAKTQALLGADAFLLPLDWVTRQSIEDDPQIQEAMRRKSRPGWAAKAALSDEGLRERGHALAKACTGALNIPVLLQLRSPLMLLKECDAIVEGGNDFDEDNMETAAVYLADWVRRFADAGVAGLLFDERTDGCDREVYQPITNTAEHYQWTVGYRSDAEVVFTEGTDSVAVPVAGDDLWSGDGSAEPPLFSQIPADAEPETVLAVLKRLRG